MSTIGIIPARGGSKRVVGKNKRILVDKPLVCWVIEAALSSDSLDLIVVSSDDEEILEIAGNYKGIISIKRPDNISRDKSPAIDYVNHALEMTELNNNYSFETIVILQPSSPLTIAEDINSTVQLLLSTNADTAVSIMKVDHAIHPIKLKKLDGNRLYPLLEEENGRMAAYELPEVFVRNCAVYATRRHVISSGRIIGDDCRGYIMPRSRSIDINEEFDLMLAEFLLKGSK